MASLWDAFTNTNAQNAANAQTNAIQTALPTLENYYNTARGDLTQNYMQGLQPFMQNYSQAQPGVQSFSDALGVNGPQGNARATTAFWNNPAINSAILTGTENVTRAANATGGGPQSGATQAALQNLAQNTASQGWQNYVSNLQNFLPFASTNAAGIGNLYAGLGQGEAGLAQGQGNAAFGGITSIGNAQANADLANQQASANEWGAIGGLLGAGTKLAGYSPTTGASNLFGVFGRAKGGPVAGGQPHIVGEEGPELFVPHTDGHIVPNPATMARMAMRTPGRAPAREMRSINRFPSGDTRMAA